MPSIKVLKSNGELVEEFELTEKYKGAWVADDALERAGEVEGDIIELPSTNLILMASASLGSKNITRLGATYKSKPFDIKTARKSLLSIAIKGNK